jgi:hypothetical protein
MMRVALGLKAARFPLSARSEEREYRRSFDSGRRR